MPATDVRSKFLPLFTDFVTEYLSQPVGIEHIDEARRVVADGRRNYEEILRAQDRGEDITDMVLARLLPHGDYPENAGRVWVHYAPTIHRDVRREYGAKYGRGDADWQAVARAIFRFVRRATGNPADVEAAAREFAESGQGKGFQSGTLSPILAAVDPEKFLLINNKSLTVINYFAGTRHEQSITSYAAANATGRALVAEHADRMIEAAGREGVPAWMLFDTFTHWLVAVRGYFDKAKEPKPDIEPPVDDDGGEGGSWVADLFAEFYPDPAERHFAETMLADAVELAGSFSGTNWSLTYRKDHDLVRLNVGKVEAMVLSAGAVRLLLDMAEIRDEGRKLADGVLEFEGGQFKSLSIKTVWGDADVSWVMEHYNIFRAAHHSFIKHASATVSGRSTWARHHAPEIIEYLQSELGRALPNPTYVREGSDSIGDDHTEAQVEYVDMTTTPISSAGAADLRNLLLPLLERLYPAWTGFSDPRFVEDEVGYKQNAVKAAAEMLGREDMARLLENGDHAEVISRLKSVAKHGGNLLYMTVPARGDLRVLYAPGFEAGSFCAAMFDLLYGEGESPARLDRYFSYCEEAGLPLYSAFPTYFLFVCLPDTELFVKPMVIRRFAELVGRPGILNAPRGADYAKVLALAHDVRAAFEQYAPHDMVDIQSLIWICATGDRPAVDPKRIETRAAAEKRARAIVTEKLGAFTDTDLRGFLREVNKDWENGREHHNRFGTAFGGSLVQMLIDNLSVLNTWTERLWNANDAVLDAMLDEFWRESPVKGARQGYATMLLYLKDPERFAIWLPALDKGLGAVTDYAPTSELTAAAYRRYLRAVEDLRVELGLPPQAVDHVLSRAKDLEPRPRAIPPSPPVREDTAFRPEAFALLGRLHEAPVKATYLERKTEFGALLEEPFARLMSEVAALLPAPMLETMETKQGTIARILKNDYGRGGAWDFYWGAFYPKGGKRTEDAQLYVWMNRDRLEYGFYIGEYGTRQRERFVAGCRAHQDMLQSIVAESMREDVRRRFGRRPEFVGREAGRGDGQSTLSFPEWLRAPEAHGIQVGVLADRAEILRTPLIDLARSIAETFEELYPLVLLALEDRPAGPIRAWLGLETDAAVTNAPYPMPDMAAATGFTEEELARWVRAIERKKQAIIYGPPGTGKTYMAGELARHLIGGGAGFTDTVQFHPAYAYEDFMQGIRPRLTSGGGLDYALAPGRFLEFCERARGVEGTCVMIVDEINRANLARVFGELMYLLEYRDRKIPLAAGGTFAIPENVRIIGTMNTADRSIALVDHALRRRFAFLELRPDFEVLRRFHASRATGFPVDALIRALERLNAAINDGHYSMGISYFLRDDLAECLEDIWRMEIAPYLQEYFYDQPTKAKAFAWEEIGGSMREREPDEQ